MEHLHKKIEFLENPQKRGDVPPEKLLNLVTVNATDTILDIGAGTGYHTIPAAKMVEAGTVYALDIDKKMLEIIETKAEKEKLINIKTILGQLTDLSITNQSINIAIASLVLHEVKSLQNSLQQIYQLLKSEGYFICVELEKEDAEHHHPRISSVVMEQELIEAGFKVEKKYIPSKSIYIIIAQK